jgi:hypothetical protein
MNVLKLLCTENTPKPLRLHVCNISVMVTARSNVGGPGLCSDTSVWLVMGKFSSELWSEPELN